MSATLGVLLLSLLTPLNHAQAQTPPTQPAKAPSDQSPDSPEKPTDAGAVAPTTPPSSKPKDNFPTDANARLQRAQQAYQNAEYSILRPLLLPTLEPNILLTNKADRLEARTLLGVGAFFEAQAAKDAATRDQLNAVTREQFLEILREDPTHALDALVYPVSIIDIYKSVKQANKQELDKILAKQQGQNPDNSSSNVQTIYIERSISEHYFALNLLPFGVGQYQNGQNIKGTAFAITQGVALGLNVISYLVIESLRSSSTGYIAPDDLAQALAWQQVQYSALGVFSGLYIWSVIDGIYYHEDVRFRNLRTLDKPPNELRPKPENQLAPSLKIGWRWRF